MMEKPDQKGRIILRVKARVISANGRRRILTPEAQVPLAKKDERNPALIKALLQAYRYNDEIFSGKYRSIGDLSAKKNENNAYIARVIRLSLLSPEVKEAILDGRQPKTLTVLHLLNGFPLEWNEQKKYLGFI